MALRTKTIEYAFPFSTASVATAVARTWTAVTVNIPETTSRTFRSVIVEYTAFDAATVAASVTAVNLSIDVGAAAASAATVTQTIANSGENQSFYFTKDATAYFQTNFTGASQVVTAAMTVTGIATQNASCKIIITYEFDDAAATTRIKTVKIPMDGFQTALTTAYTNMGGLTLQIPNLSTFLPESTKVYRSIFFEMHTHTGTSAAATSTLDMSYDGGTTTVADLTHAATLNSDVYYHRIDDLTATLNTAAAGTISAKVTSITGRPTPCLNGVLVVTYEYDHSASTRIINSIQFPVMDEAGYSGGTVIGNASRFRREISVQEPGTITLLQSGIMATFNASAAVTVNFLVGGQTARTYAHAATARSGCVSFMRRIDAGSAGGVVGLTLARGPNTLTIDWFTTAIGAGTAASNMSGLCYLNYTSDKHADGDMMHNHTTFWITRAHSTGNLVPVVQAAPLTTPIIQATNFWLTGAGYQIILHPSTGAAALGIAVLGEVQAAEAEGAGWRPMYSSIIETDAEVAPYVMFARVRDDFKRWTGDPDTNRLNIETVRDYRYDTNVATSAFWQMEQFITYHAITYTIGGTISGSAGGTVTITAYRVSDGLEVGTTTRTGNGTFSIIWHDDTSPVVVEAYETSTLKGLSIQQVANNTNVFDINLAGGGGGGPTYYAYV